MTPVRSALSRSYLGLMTVAILAFTSCAAQQPAESDDAGSESASPSTMPADTAHENDVLLAEVDDPVEFEVCHEAEQLEGATVEWLDDVVIEEQRIEGVGAQTVDIEGEAIEIPGAPELVIPERVAQAGCIIEYPAPGGCLPAVEISGAYIPGFRIPERRLEDFELPDGTVLEGVSQKSLEVEAVHVDGIREEQVCQTEPPEPTENAQIVSSVIRPAMTRPYELSQTELQPYAGRGGGAAESGTHINVMALNSYSTKPLWVPAAHVPSDHLESFVVEGADHTEFAERDEVTAYTTESDVLFDSDDHELRDDAAAELQVIADDLATRGHDVIIRIEGHTDNLPSEKYADNAELSERRAESAMKWFTENTDIPAAAMTAEGLGDRHPRASNSSEAGRQQNRRVVVTVMPKDYEPEIEYQTDDSGTPTQ